MNRSCRLGAIAALLVAATSGSASAQLLISGNDARQVYDDAAKAVFSPPGKDTASIIDIRDRAKPKIVASLPVPNTITGPPTNVAIAPDGRLALVANSLELSQAPDGAWKTQPADKVFVIDLTTTPPSVAGTVTTGKQPSGLAISRQGDLALVANRAENSVTVLALAGREARVVDTVALAAPGAPNEQVSSVAISPDGKRALVTKFAAHKVAVLDIEGQKVTYTKYDMSTGLWPYNVQITPDGKLGVVANNGASGQSDGQVDTLAVVDLQAKPPRVVDQVAVGDGPEGLAVSPVGGWVAAVLLNGTGNVPRTAFFARDRSYVVLLKSTGKTLRKVALVDVGYFAEGVAFSPDGKYLYVGNFGDAKHDATLEVLRIEKDRLKKVGALPIPQGRPASLRAMTP